MSFLDTAREHFRNGGQHSLEVPEWGVTIHWHTPNGKTWAKIAADSKGNAVEQSCRLVALIARDADGKPLMNYADYLTLMSEVDPAVVARIAAAMSKGMAVDPVEAEKN